MCSSSTMWALLDTRMTRQGETVDDLLKRYVEAARIHGAATLAGDSARANAAHDEVAEIYRGFRARGREDQRRLLVLLDHPDPSVVAWAGAHALEFAPAEGEPALVALAQQDRGVLGFTSEMTLEEWRAGRLQFP
jgi:hypothetical protein